MFRRCLTSASLESNFRASAASLRLLAAQRPAPDERSYRKTAPKSDFFGIEQDLAEKKAEEEKQRRISAKRRELESAGFDGVPVDDAASDVAEIPSSAPPALDETTSFKESMTLRDFGLEPRRARLARKRAALALPYAADDVKTRLLSGIEVRLDAENLPLAPFPDEPLHRPPPSSSLIEAMAPLPSIGGWLEWNRRRQSEISDAKFAAAKIEGPKEASTNYFDEQLEMNFAETRCASERTKDWRGDDVEETLTSTPDKDESSANFFDEQLGLTSTSTTHFVSKDERLKGDWKSDLEDMSRRRSDREAKPDRIKEELTDLNYFDSLYVENSDFRGVGAEMESKVEKGASMSSLLVESGLKKVAPEKKKEASSSSSLMKESRFSDVQSKKEASSSSSSKTDFQGSLFMNNLDQNESAKRVIPKYDYGVGKAVSPSSKASASSTGKRTKPKGPTDGEAASVAVAAPSVKWEAATAVEKVLYPPAKLGKKMFDSKGFRKYKDLVADLTWASEDHILELLRRRVVFNHFGLVGLDKPYGLACQGGPGVRLSVDDVLPKLAEALGHSKLTPLHRLDREVTGVLLLSASDVVTQRVKRLFATRRALKVYLAICKGKPTLPHGTIEIPLKEFRGNAGFRTTVAPFRDAMTADTFAAQLVEDELDEEDLKRLAPPRQTGFKAVTRYEVLDENFGCSLIEVQPESGFKHQVRAHLSYGLNTPVVGDHKYSNLNDLKPQKISGSALQALKTRQPLARHVPLQLHAKTIVLPELNKGKNVFVSANLPFHFREIMKQLNLTVPELSGGTRL